MLTMSLLPLLLSGCISLSPADEPAARPPQPAQPAGGQPQAPPPSPERGGSAFKLPWQIDHEYHFSWVFKRTKAGDSYFRISEVEVPSGEKTRKLYLTRFRYAYKKEGISQEGKSETYYDQAFKPVRYTLHKQV